MENTILLILRNEHKYIHIEIPSNNTYSFVIISIRIARKEGINNQRWAIPAPDTPAAAVLVPPVVAPVVATASKREAIYQEISRKLKNACERICVKHRRFLWQKHVWLVCVKWRCTIRMCVRHWKIYIVCCYTNILCVQLRKNLGVMLFKNVGVVV